MIIDLNSFERELPIDAKFGADEIDLELPNARISGDVSVEGTLEKNAATIVLKGRLSGIAEVDCDRCLEARERPFEVPLDLEFVPEQAFGAEANLEIRGDDLKVDALAENELDLSRIVREQILLDIPQQFFCTEDCQGLCQKCGTNLNVENCDCTDEEIDPRWAALKNLN